MKAAAAFLLLLVAGCATSVPACHSNVVPVTVPGTAEYYEVFIGCDDQCHLGSKAGTCVCKKECPCWKNHMWHQIEKPSAQNKQ